MMQGNQLSIRISFANFAGLCIRVLSSTRTSLPAARLALDLEASDQPAAFDVSNTRHTTAGLVTTCVPVECVTFRY